MSDGIDIQPAPGGGSGSGVTLPIAESDVTNLTTDLAAKAPVGAKYIVQTADATLTAEQSLGALATGILKSTTTTGVLSIAAGSDLPTGIPIASLADPTTGKVIGSAGSAAAAVFPPGYQYAYTAIAANATSTQTVRANATTVIGPTSSVTYDGTAVMIHVSAAYLSNSSATTTILTLWEDSTDIGIIVDLNTIASGVTPVNAWYQRTPSAGAHTYTVKMYCSAGTATLGSDTTGSPQTFAPAFIRVVKV